MKYISRKNAPIARILIDSCMFALRVKPDDLLLHNKLVAGNYVLMLYNVNPKAKLFYLGDFKYMLQISKNHHYEFGSKYDLAALTRG